MTDVTVSLAQALDRAVAACNAGNLSGAEQLCQQIIARQHDYFDAVWLLAFVQSSLGKKEAALTSYDRAISLRPDHPGLLNDRGNTLYELRRLDQALASFDRALSLRPDFAEALNNRGNTLKELKRFDEALASYERAITLRPNYANALNNRGVTLKALERFEEALASYDRALAVQTDYAEALNYRGNTLSELKRFEEALLSYERAIALRPEYAEALNNRGNTLRELKRFDEAVASYDRAVTVRPDYASAFNNRGVILKELKRFDEALASYDRAIALQPDYAEALNYRGNTLWELKRLDEALASYERAIAARPDYSDALNNRGVILKELKRYDEALASYDSALAIQPSYADALNNRGNVLRELKRFEDALASYDQALAVRPRYANALNNRGITLERLRRFDEAVADYEAALALWPNYPAAINNLGNVLQQQRRFDEALAAYERAIALQPDFAEPHYNNALCRLLIGDFERGWQEHEWRWQCAWLLSSKRHFNQPSWIGHENISGKTILLHAEQGFGDTIQFCRYVPLVLKLGAHVLLEVPRPLYGLMSTIGGVAQIIRKGESLPNFDVHCPLMSLPLAFSARFKTIPSGAPYLLASSRASLDWSKRLGPKRHPRIGLAWFGSRQHKNDHNRSMSLKSLSPLLKIDATFVSLQQEIGSEDAAVLKDQGGIVRCSGGLKDFADTAALITNLDLVISVDTSVAHLAGALGKAVWVLLPFLPDWRWLLDRNDSPWYPTARLFRQNETRTWSNVIARVRAELSDFVRSHS